jgi:hypothetical protein
MQDTWECSISQRLLWKALDATQPNSLGVLLFFHRSAAHTSAPDFPEQQVTVLCM